MKNILLMHYVFLIFFGLVLTCNTAYSGRNKKEKNRTNYTHSNQSEPSDTSSEDSTDNPSSNNMDVIDTNNSPLLQSLKRKNDGPELESLYSLKKVKALPTYQQKQTRYCTYRIDLLNNHSSLVSLFNEVRSIRFYSESQKIIASTENFKVYIPTEIIEEYFQELKNTSQIALKKDSTKNKAFLYSKILNEVKFLPHHQAVDSIIKINAEINKTKGKKNIYDISDAINLLFDNLNHSRKLPDPRFLSYFLSKFQNAEIPKKSRSIEFFNDTYFYGFDKLFQSILAFYGPSDFQHSLDIDIKRYITLILTNLVIENIKSNILPYSAFKEEDLTLKIGRRVNFYREKREASIGLINRLQPTFNDLTQAAHESFINTIGYLKEFDSTAEGAASFQDAAHISDIILQHNEHNILDKIWATIFHLLSKNKERAQELRHELQNEFVEWATYDFPYIDPDQHVLCTADITQGSKRYILSTLDGYTRFVAELGEKMLADGSASTYDTLLTLFGHFMNGNEQRAEEIQALFFSKIRDAQL
jgi:hypothetical protein